MRSADPHAINPCSTESPRSADPARAARGAARPGRIVRSEYLHSESLEPARRCALVDRFYAIYCETLHGYTRDEFETLLVFGAGEVRLALYYGVGDELAGFAYASVEHIDHAGRTHAALCAGMFFRRGYRGGVPGALFLLGQGLRAKLRAPHIPLAYMTRCTTPAVYRRLAMTMPRIYPSRKHQTPANIEALVRALGARRCYVPLSESPWVVRALGMPHDVSRLRRLDNDPDVRFYAELNPRFAEGESLVVWVHGGLTDIASGFVRALGARIAT